jgi:subtilisin family serine protease
MAPGEDISVASSGGTYSQSGGTSIAAPHVTAAVALMHSLPITKLDTLAQKHPETLAQLIKTSLIEGVKKIDRLESVCRSSGKLNLMGAYYTILKKLGYTNFNSIIENVYPNPISINTPITIEIKSKTLGQQFDLRWYDSAGRLLMATPISTTTVGGFKISTAPPTLFSGLYFLKAYEPQTGNSQVRSIFVD